MRCAHIVFIAVLFMLTGCGSIAKQGVDYTLTNTAPAVQPPNVPYGTVIFIREPGHVGGAVSYFIWENDKTIGVLRSGSKFQHATTPGKRTFWAYTEAKEFITLDIKEGETACVVGGVGIGAWVGRPTLKQADPSVCDLLGNELPYTVMTVKGQKETPP